MVITWFELEASLASPDAKVCECFASKLMNLSRNKYRIWYL